MGALKPQKRIETIEDLRNIKLNALQIYNDRYIKIKMKAYCD